MRYRIIIFLLSIIVGKSFSQNLVPNSSFEEYTSCPIKEDQLSYCKYWNNPILSNSSADYYNHCDSSTKRNSVPKNELGFQRAHSGQAYVGISTFDEQHRIFEEYIQAKLIHPMVKGHLYKLSMYVSLADTSQYYNDQIHFCFSDTNLIWRRMIQGYFALFCEEGAKVVNPNLFNDTINWQEVTTYYYAHGDEKYLTIGVFKNDVSKRKYKTILKNNHFNSKGKYKGAYYYIDDVSVEEVNKGSVR